MGDAATQNAARPTMGDAAAQDAARPTMGDAATQHTARPTMGDEVTGGKRYSELCAAAGHFWPGRNGKDASESATHGRRISKTSGGAAD